METGLNVTGYGRCKVCDKTESVAWLNMYYDVCYECHKQDKVIPPNLASCATCNRICWYYWLDGGICNQCKKTQRVALKDIEFDKTPQKTRDECRLRYPVVYEERQEQLRKQAVAFGFKHPDTAEVERLRKENAELKAILSAIASAATCAQE